MGVLKPREPQACSPREGTRWGRQQAASGAPPPSLPGPSVLPMGQAVLSRSVGRQPCLAVTTPTAPHPAPQPRGRAGLQANGPPRGKAMQRGQICMSSCPCFQRGVGVRGSWRGFQYVQPLVKISPHAWLGKRRQNLQPWQQGTWGLSLGGQRTTPSQRPSGKRPQRGRSLVPRPQGSQPSPSPSCVTTGKPLRLSGPNPSSTSRRERPAKRRRQTDPRPAQQASGQCCGPSVPRVRPSVEAVGRGRAAWVSLPAQTGAAGSPCLLSRLLGQTLPQTPGPGASGPPASPDPPQALAFGHPLPTPLPQTERLSSTTREGRILSRLQTRGRGPE